MMEAFDDFGASVSENSFTISGLISEQRENHHRILGTSEHFLRRPLYFWAKSFVEKSELRREDSFSRFINSTVLDSALEFIGINSPSDPDQSSLHLSGIFDESQIQHQLDSGIQTPGGSISLTSNTSAASVSSSRSNNKSGPQSSETKRKILYFNQIFKDLKSFYEDHFEKLLLLQPPNALHVATHCPTCSVEELEKYLVLLLGGAVGGNQKYDTIRKIKSFPKSVQEELIESIKTATENPDLVCLKPWADFSAMDPSRQQIIYENLVGQLQRVTNERNVAIQDRYLAEYYIGLLSCEQKDEFESKGGAGDSLLDLDKTSQEESRAVMRHLREELLEKSDLLQECREELEMTKNQLQDLLYNLTETQQELKSCKKARDEFDVLREGQDKAQRLEAELLKTKKRLEESEQYYERLEILQNENRNYQRKHAILMDQINMLSIEKERLEVSFMQMSSRDLNLSQMSDNEVYVPPPQNELIEHDDLGLGLDSGDENKPSELRNISPPPEETVVVPSISISPPPEEPQAKDPIEEPNELQSTDPIEEPNELQPTEPIEEPKEPQVIVETQAIPVKQQEVSIQIDPINYDLDTTQDADDQLDISSLAETNEQECKVEEEDDDDEAVVPTQDDLKSERSDKGRRSKRGSRRGHHSKRSKKSSIPIGSTKVVLQKVANLGTSIEQLDDVRNSESYSPMSSPSKHSSRSSRKHHSRHGIKHSSHRKKRSTTPSSEKHLVPNLLDYGNDADEELSLSPNYLGKVTSTSSESELDKSNQSSKSYITRHIRKPSPPIRYATNIATTIVTPISGQYIGEQSSEYAIRKSLEPVIRVNPQSKILDEENENDVFFVCPTSLPATARNVKISKGRNIQLGQGPLTSTSEIIPNRQSNYSETYSNSNNSPGQGLNHNENHELEPRPPFDDLSQNLLSRCNIEVNFRSVNTNSHELHLSPISISGRKSPVDPNQNILINPGVIPECLDSSSSEDDDSVWYEYGCV